MFYPSSIHTHTQFCDGKNTMEEMAQKAAALGLESLGFSPHSPLPYENDWAMKEESYAAYFAECRRLKELFRGRTEIFCGVEWDSQTEKLPDGFDFVISAVHSLVKNGECFSVDYEKELLVSVVRRLYKGEILELCKEFFEETVRASLRSGAEIVAHLDLVTKYNKDGEILNESDPEYLRMAKNCIDRILDARPEIFFEINTGVMARAGKKDPYPSPELLAHLVGRGARLVLTCDCHRTEQMCFGYGRAKELLGALSHPKLYMLTRGGFTPCAL